MTGYTDTIRRYALDDRYTGELSNPDGIGEVGLGADEAGRRLAVRFCLQLRGKSINTVRFQVFGCGFTIAACTAAAELAEGQTLAEVINFPSTAISQRLGGLPEERSYCADLAVEALRAAARSAAGDRQSVQAGLTAVADHSPRLTPADQVYRALLGSAAGADIPDEDRKLFAGLLAIANQEPVPLHRALNLSPRMLNALLLRVFPNIDRRQLFGDSALRSTSPPEVNPDLEHLLLSFVTAASGWEHFASLALAHCLAARAAHPGHLWIAMGFFERAELTAAIARHLPELLAANHQRMRWKRFLFKRLCELNGGTLCKSPNCADCSDYSSCFAEE